jgi:opacity protein-like surface antigen
MTKAGVPERVLKTAVLAGLMMTLSAPVSARAQLATRSFDDYARSLVAPRFDAKAGYWIHPNLAAEANLRKFEKGQVETAGAVRDDAAGWSATANAKGYPWTGRVQPYGLVGMGVLFGRVRQAVGMPHADSAFVTRFGGGADFYATENVVLNVDVSYMYTPGELNVGGDTSVRPDLIPVVFGLRYRF